MPLEKATESSHILSFGDFVLELRTGELRTNGHRTILQEKPFQILVALLERPGEMVTREELIQRLWPVGTFVDFNLGLNKAVNRLREVLEDTADNPIFIETIPRRGYRFIAPVRVDLSLLEPVPSAEFEARAESAVGRTVESRVKPRRSAARLVAIGMVLMVTCGVVYRGVFPPALRVTQIARLTNSGRLEPWGRIASDGSRLFFLERDGDHWNTRQASVAGGESVPFGSSPRNTKIFDVSPDKSEMLFAPFTMRSADLALWSMPLVGGAPRRVGDILASAANFSPDGTRIAFTNTNGAFIANHDGSGLRQLASLHDCWSIAWSPDGKIIRFTQDGPHLWQVSPAGGDLHPFLPSWAAREGRWTTDGSYYIFASPKESPKTLKDAPSTLWALRESSFPAWPRPTPRELAFAPFSMDNPLPSRDGHTIFAFGGLGEQIDVVRFDPGSHQFKPVLPGFHVNEVEFSPDHQWMLYTNWNQLWRSRPDGSDRLQLAGPPSMPHNYFAQWSPDSKNILFEDVEDDKGTIYLVSAEGGPVQQPLPPGPSRRDPTWSADGQTIVFSIDEQPTAAASSKRGLYLYDLATGRSTLLPGSTGLALSRWSPDGHFLAAVSEDGSAVKLLDLRRRRWREVARGTLITFAMWSADSVLYFQDILAPGEPVYRVQPGASAQQRIYSFEDILQSGAQRCAFQGFAPDGSLLVQVNRGGGDVYALSLNLP
jgi:Tol biopolymer transport system component/DNA-binding winged helix-turn-helix (wHTH) protein